MERRKLKGGGALREVSLAGSSNQPHEVPPGPFSALHGPQLPTLTDIRQEREKAPRSALPAEGPHQPPALDPF